MKTAVQRIAITTGDADGIGFEVTAKALAHLGPQSKYQFVIFRSVPTRSEQTEVRAIKTGARRSRIRAGLSLEKPNDKSVNRPTNKSIDELVRTLSRKFKRVEVHSWPELMAIDSSKYKILIDFVTPTAPAKWVELAAQACLSGSFAAMVTGPLSKPAIKASGLNDMGHTEILKRLSGATNVTMGFLGEKFSVVLATGHIPLAKVSKQLDAEKLRAAVTAAEQLRLLVPRNLKKLPIAVLGLNPHAGDEGLIGNEDADLLTVEIAKLKSDGLAVEGPLVPDAAFSKDNWKKYSVFVACYHDQGLIPFKMIHGFDSGAQVSLGLPIIRTSVDHGTARDIFGQNRAKFGSMQSAIELAIRMIEERP